MKKVTSCLCIALQSLSLYAQGTMDINGSMKYVDTLEYRSVGPSAMYSHLNLPEYPLKVHILTLDLTDKYNQIETFLGNDSIHTIELVTDACKRFTFPGHYAFGGINGDFYNVSANSSDFLGAPRGGSIYNGIVQREPDSDWWGFCSITGDKKPVIDYMYFVGEITDSKGRKESIAEVNRHRLTNRISMYNRYAGKRTHTDNNGTEVFIKPKNGMPWRVNQPVVCEVISIVKGKGANEIPLDQTVLSGNGTGEAYLNDLQIGEEITINMGVNTVTDKLKPDIRELIGGNAILMKNNVLTDRNYNDSYNYTLQPRTAVGCSADGKMLYLMVVDGRQVISKGLDTETLCGIMKSTGAVDVVGLDGGGSAEMIVDQKVANSPSDGKERPVGNGWIAISTAPESDVVDRIEPVRPYFFLRQCAIMPLEVQAVNKYGKAVEISKDDIGYSVLESLGKIADQSLFIAGDQTSNGFIDIHYQGKSSRIRVDVALLENISLNQDSYVVDDKTPVQINAFTTDVFGKHNLDVSMLTWKVEDPAICSCENGLLTGLSNGKTKVTVSFGDVKKEVNVESIIIRGDQLADKIDDVSTWKITNTATITDFKTSHTNLPQTWGYGTSVKGYAKVGTRKLPVNFIFAKDLVAKGMPDSIKLHISTGDLPLSGISIRYQTAQGVTIKKDVKAIPVNYKGEICISTYTNEVFNSMDYPITFKQVQFDFDNSKMTANQVYSLDAALKDVLFKYNDNTVSEERIDADFQINLMPNPAVDYVDIYLKLEYDQCVDILLQDLSGNLIWSKKADVNPDSSCLERINTSSFAKGVYLITVKTAQAMITRKLIVK